MKFERITVNPEQMGGVPCVRGLRIPVATIVGMVAEGISQAEILRAHPDLKKEDIREALRYAAEDIKAGRVTTFDSVGHLIKGLEQK